MQPRIYNSVASLFNRLFGDERKPKRAKKTRDSADKLTVYQVYGEYAAKDDLQAILDGLGMASAGNKDDLIRRLAKALEGKAPSEALGYLNKEVLKDVCSDYGLPVGGNKEDLVGRLIAGVVIEGLPIDVASNAEPSSPEDILRDMLLKDVVKDDVQSALTKLDLQISGSKDELVSRLLGATGGAPRPTLALFDALCLNDIADRRRLPRRRSRSDQIDEIMVAMFGEERERGGAGLELAKVQPRAVAAISNSEPVESIVIRSKQDVGPVAGHLRFQALVREIEDWTPQIRHPTEDGYRASLNGYLQGKGYSTKMESGESLADILVNDEIPIEMKKNPIKSSYNAAIGQLLQHCKAHGSVIIVICDPKRLDDFDEFSRDVKENLYRWPIAIIKK